MGRGVAACGITTDTVLQSPATQTAEPAATSGSPGRTAAGWALAGGAVFVVTALVSLGRPANLTDETWMLWVGHRVANGETLYRDVYFVTTPLAAWLTALVSAVIGSHLVVLRLLV